MVALDDESARVCDLEGRVLSEFEERDDLKCLTVSPDGTRVVTAGRSKDGKGLAWISDLDGNTLATLDSHEGYIESVRYARDGSAVVTVWRDMTRSDNGTVSWDYTVRVSRPSGEQIAQLPGEGADISPSGDKVVVLVDPLEAQLYDLGGALLATFRMTDPDGDAICITDGDGNAEGWFDADVVFSPRGDAVLTTTEGGALFLWDVTGRQLMSYTGHWVGAVCFSPAGEWILVACEDGTVRVIDLEGRELLLLRGHEDSVKTAIFSPDGSRILTVGEDQTVRLWDAEGEELGVFEAESDIYDACFSPDGTMLAMVVRTQDGAAALLYHVRTADLLRLAERRTLRGFTEEEHARYGALLEKGAVR